ncbi:hypothetical protein ACNKHN_04190 [Shigella flexneri]
MIPALAFLVCDQRVCWMHRKIVVIDARIAFIGGLNHSASICPAMARRPTGLRGSPRRADCRRYSPV